jgi:hypothetical protein
MKSVSSGKTRGSHPHHRRKKKTKSYVKFPKRLKKRKASAKLGTVLPPLTLFDAKFINNIAYPKDKKPEKKEIKTVWSNHRTN